MSLVTQGFANDTFTTTIPRVVLVGFYIGETSIDLVALDATPQLILSASLTTNTMQSTLVDLTLKSSFV